ncbi:uncharacterized protein LY89DRAFT_73425 [Mollisia scopiformis]|uniref:Zn(2)-C6 fungal-type domain-containing protein n=1 Tax=Mollisia scopiformis TaxID=149040 RepID=A0A194XAJ5_MOLSC|nr:uncharacterized protein LY89DRAFT_73425 [Mollisia scopiformis]KUJ17186.1 hypothetical protein LY89DRAFT_73425 [Mollisia scopiformis]
MNPRSPSSSTAATAAAVAGTGYPPHKRARHDSPAPKSPKSVLEELETPAAVEKGAGKAGQSSSFRNVSACNRCRLRKNRCDQRLPSCASCEKASVKCVGYDPITKREIPRSYVFYLETRVGNLERLLQEHSIPFPPADVLDHSSRPGPDPTTVQTPSDDGRPIFNGTDPSITSSLKQSPQEAAWNKKQDESEKLNKLVSNVGSISVQGASDSRYLGSTSGISFARVVFAAVKSSVSGTNSDKSGVRPSRPPIPAKAAAAGPNGTSMRDSFFGLHTKPTIKQAPFPSKEVGRRLVEFYFEHANPQIPILHRGEFSKMFEAAYEEGDRRVRTSRELYMLNMVFAIGSGIFLGDHGEREKEKEERDKRRSGLDKQCQPEEYHASAIVHLEACLSSSSTSIIGIEGFGGGLEELQAVLLLAGFALLRPVAPGLWYIIGVAVRLAVDLGLHYEDGKDLDVGLEDMPEEKAGDPELVKMQREKSARERGRREYVRDFRRRLWWCTYSFDRLVSTCVGRPFGITDQVVTTEFPSLLDDKYITPSGFMVPTGGPGEPSYKHAAYHYFRLRLLQSEILQVLQHQQAQQARATGANQQNPFMHTTLPSPFLSKFDSFRSWRIDIDKRLWEWKTSAPTRKETGVGFSVEFLELNYWQCVIMLYRQSLSVPTPFEGEFNTSDEVNSPNVHNVELREDEERVFLKVAEAGQRVLRLYRQLHRVHLVNYTFLATHHLFMAGISFLYAIWHSSIVRSRLTMDEVDFTILAATSVLGDLIEKCPPAEACRDAFDRMSKATVQMCMSTTGFGSSAHGLNSRQRSHSQNQRHTQSESGPGSADYFSKSARRQSRGPHGPPRPKPQFDMALNDLLGPVSTSQQSPSTPTQPQPQNFRPRSQNSGVKMELDPYASSSTATPRQTTAQHTTSPSDYAISPPLSQLDTSAIDPSLLPSPSATGPYAAAVQSTYPSNPYQEMQFPFQNAPGMDFLNSSAWDTGLGGNTTNGGNGGNNWMGGGDLGMGLGMDMQWIGDGVDGEHDFSEGGNGGVDLFDGFFFGGTGNF